MKKYLLYAFLIILMGCEKKESSDIIYTELNQSLSTSVVSGSYGLSSGGIDLNLDGVKDYSVMASYTKADGIYTMEDEHHIYIRPIYMYNNEYNPYTPYISMEGNWFVTLYPTDDGYFNDSSGVFTTHWLYKVDEEDNYAPQGRYYIALKLSSTRFADKSYYGWLQVEFEDFGIHLLDYAFCTTANKKIHAGQMK